MNVEIIVDNKPYAARSYAQIPSVDDHINLSGKLYIVEALFWRDPDRTRDSTLVDMYVTGVD